MMFTLLGLFAPHYRALNYLDPGSGSINVQVLIAGLMAVGSKVKVFWKKIKGIFSRPFEKNEDDPPTGS
jgi:hypothetical protein